MVDKEQSALVEMPAQTRCPRSLRAFRHRNFRLFWSGQVFSLSGSWMQTVALNWLVYQLTDSPLMLGLVNFIALLPVGLVSLVGGVISDRFPRRRLMLSVQIVLAFQALVLAILTWTGLVQVWHVIVVTFVVGAANAIQWPASFAFLIDIVGKEDFTSAVSLNASMLNLARFIGPAVAGVLIGWLGEASCFFLNFVTYLAIVFVLLLIQLPHRHSLGKPMRLRTDLLDGLKYVWQNPTIKSLLVIIAASSFLSRPYLVLMPVFAQDVLQVDSRGYGLLMSAVGVGAVCGALIAGSVERAYHRRWLIRSSLAFPIFLMLFVASHWMLLSVGLLLLVAVGQFIQQVLVNSSLQLAADERFHGRVTSFYLLFSNGLMYLGGVQAGAVAQYWGAPVAVAGGALLSLAWILIVIWRMPIKGWLQQ